MVNSFLSKFKPKEPKFFPLLSGLSDVIIEISEMMIEFIKNYNPDTAEEYYKKVKIIEREGDKLSNKIFDELNITFITPFDREDINNLSSTMDDVNDYVNSAAKRIYLYRPVRMPNEALQLAKNIKESALYIKKSVDELQNLKKRTAYIKEYCYQLHVIENNSDDIYELFLIDLFKNGKDAIEVIKEKEFVYELEKATDAAETVGKIIKTIIVKYA